MRQGAIQILRRRAFRGERLVSAEALGWEQWKWRLETVQQSSKNQIHKTLDGGRGWSQSKRLGDLGIGTPGSESGLHHLLAVWLLTAAVRNYHKSSAFLFGGSKGASLAFPASRGHLPCPAFSSFFHFKASSRWPCFCHHVAFSASLSHF